MCFGWDLCCAAELAIESEMAVGPVDDACSAFAAYIATIADLATKTEKVSQVEETSKCSSQYVRCEIYCNREGKKECNFHCC